MNYKILPNYGELEFSSFTPTKTYSQNPNKKISFVWANASAEEMLPYGSTDTPKSFQADIEVNAIELFGASTESCAN